MTPNAVQPITDEQLTEVEDFVKSAIHRGHTDAHFTLDEIDSLIARLRAAEKDVKRMDWIEENYTGDGGGNHFNMRLCFEHDIDEFGDSARGIIDAAMHQG